MSNNSHLVHENPNTLKDSFMEVLNRKAEVAALSTAKFKKINEEIDYTLREEELNMTKNLNEDNSSQTPEEATRSELVRTLIDKRNSLGWTQRVLAEKSGVPQESISRVESGKVAPHIHTIVKLAEVMGLNLTLQDKKTNEGLDLSPYKDMSKYREGREQSRVVQTWLNDYKQQILGNVIYREANSDSVSKETLDTIYDGSPRTAEIVADTMIGWLNSSVGRSFISEAFGVKLPQQPEDGSE